MITVYIIYIYRERERDRERDRETERDRERVSAEDLGRIVGNLLNRTIVLLVF